MLHRLYHASIFPLSTAMYNWPWQQIEIYILHIRADIAGVQTCSSFVSGGVTQLSSARNVTLFIKCDYYTDCNRTNDEIVRAFRKNLSHQLDSFLFIYVNHNSTETIPKSMFTVHKSNKTDNRCSNYSINNKRTVSTHFM